MYNCRSQELDKISLVFFLILGILAALIPIFQHNASALSPYSWYPRDNFDYIMEKMSRANPSNCKYLSEADLTLPITTISQMPKYNQIPLQVNFFVSIFLILYSFFYILKGKYFT